MKRFFKLVRSEFRNLFRIKWLWGYMLFLGALGLVFSYTSADPTKVLMSLLTVSLLVVPLVSSFFGITYFYDTRSFMEYLLAQPVGRVVLFGAKYFSLSLYLALLYSGGIAAALFVSGLSLIGSFLLLLLSGVLLTLSFLSLAFLIAVLVEEKARGVSLALSLWLYLTILHDGVILAVVYLFRDYPLEKPVLLLTLMNPVDLSRIMVILSTDIAALMGLTGTIFKEFFGSGLGMLMSSLSLLLWVVIPLVFSLLLFRKKDF
ncbi:MAG: ABC transporter permease subunit [Aquificae bacterium]|nr:ABC transporter permease subunit [Aquificota bacterium]